MLLDKVYNITGKLGFTESKYAVLKLFIFPNIDDDTTYRN